MNAVLALGRAKPVPQCRLTSIVRRADAATWMLNQATRHDWFVEHTTLLGT